MNATTARLAPPLLAGAVFSSILIAQATPAEAAAAQAPLEVQHPALLPRAITSFGAARANGWLYVFGGHTGRAHAHSKENITGSFARLNLADGSTWQSLPDGPALQGTALVATPSGTLVRVGGTDARNDPADDADMHSTATVSEYDPAKGRWYAKTPLPEPRSSHDAIVCGNQLYVIGGWNLQGAGDGTWHKTSWVANLDEDPLVWRELPPLSAPRRACAVATVAGKVAVLGGMNGHEPIQSVRVFDPASNSWTKGPDLPGFAFGTAAIGVGSTLYATVMDGRLLALDARQLDEHSAWRTVTQLEMPRFFHRFVEGQQPGTILAMGGAGRGGHMRSMEQVHVEAPAGAPAMLREFAIPAPSRIGYRQAVTLHDNVLWAFGGNRAHKGERFSRSQFADEIWRVELNSMTARVAGRIPSPSQSMAVAPLGKRGNALIVGGLGAVDEDADMGRSMTSGFSWHARRKRATALSAALPAPRTQHQMVSFEGIAYILGGIDFRPAPDGGESRGNTLDVLAYNPKADKPSFEATGIKLPRPRRSFGATVVHGKLYLIGGLGKGFQHAGPCDVYDFATRTWSELPAPANWVSPQVATIGSKIYVACGGTMKGRSFRSDRSVQVFEPGKGWSTVVEELPFAVRHVRMLTLRNRLIFYSVETAKADDQQPGRILIRTLQPDPSNTVLDAAFHR